MLEISLWMYIGNTFAMLTSGDVMIMVMLLDDIAALLLVVLISVWLVDNFDDADVLFFFFLKCKCIPYPIQNLPGKKG